jgi:hypothetical protein
MSWARGRQFLIIAIVVAVLAAILAVTLIATLYQAPSCMDNKQNQGEEGIDCGGPCSHLCSATVTAIKTSKFTRQLAPVSGRTDVISYIDNPNPNAAAKGVRFTITLYGPDNIVVASKEGTVDLPPNSTVPVFVPNFYSGFQTVSHAFMELDQSSFYWYRYTDTRPVLSTSAAVFSGTDAAPRYTSNISNPTAFSLFRVPVIATVFDTDNNAIAASATVLTEIPPMGSAPAVFTWNAPFPGIVSRVEVIPLVPLP